MENIQKKNFVKLISFEQANSNCPFFADFSLLREVLYNILTEKVSISRFMPYGLK